jgi:hypothetical protein
MDGWNGREMEKSQLGFFKGQNGLFNESLLKNPFCLLKKA